MNSKLNTGEAASHWLLISIERTMHWATTESPTQQRGYKQSAPPIESRQQHYCNDDPSKWREGRLIVRNKIHPKCSVVCDVVRVFPPLCIGFRCSESTGKWMGYAI